MGNEFEDESLVPELEEGFAQLERDMEEARLQTLLTGEYDSSNVILTIHPGAGGTEAQDWAQMLYRMYTRWTCLFYTSFTLNAPSSVATTFFVPSLISVSPLRSVSPPKPLISPSGCFHYTAPFSLLPLILFTRF